MHCGDTGCVVHGGDTGCVVHGGDTVCVVHGGDSRDTGCVVQMSTAEAEPGCMSLHCFYFADALFVVLIPNIACKF